jgi:predicted dehydrogenase
MHKIRIGVVGLRFGRQHVRTFANMEEVELVAVADRNPNLPEGLETFAAHYGARAWQDGVAMIEGEELDAVSICTSPGSREALITAAARRDLPMLVEKPWATDNAHARHLAGLCQRHNARVMVAFSFRFHPAIVRLRELLDGELGPGWLLNGEYIFRWVPPADSWLWDPANGNGFFNENSGHLFDAVCYLLGKPVSVMAEATNPMGAPSENAAAVTVRFASGAIAALTIGGIGAAAQKEFPRIDLVTANGQARLTGTQHIWERLRWGTRDDETMHDLLAPPEALGNTRYTHAFNHFVDSVRHQSRPSVGIEDGVTAVALAMAVYESARTGQKISLKGE